MQVFPLLHNWQTFFISLSYVMKYLFGVKRKLNVTCIFTKSNCIHSKIGEEQSAEDAEDGPPELLVSSYFFISSQFQVINNDIFHPDFLLICSKHQFYKLFIKFFINFLFNGSKGSILTHPLSFFFFLFFVIQKN